MNEQNKTSRLGEQEPQGRVAPPVTAPPLDMARPGVPIALGADDPFAEDDPSAILRSPPVMESLEGEDEDSSLGGAPMDNDLPTELMIARPMYRSVGIPEPSLVLLVGTSGSGKTTLARKHFKPTEIVGEEQARAIIADGESDDESDRATLELVQFVAGKRMETERLVVIDAVNVEAAARKPLLELARKHHVLPVAIVLDLHERVCQARNARREDRVVGPQVIRAQRREMRRSLASLRDEGFRMIYTLYSEEEVNDLSIERQPLWCNRRNETGPFDIIGDVHGCIEELEALLLHLGYTVTASDGGDGPAVMIGHPENRKLIFLGDLVDRGPDSPSVLRLVMDAVSSGRAFCVAGNHEMKLLRYLSGRPVRVSHGMAKTIEQMQLQPPAFQERVNRFLNGLISHFVLDEGRLAVAHAGLPARMIGRASVAVRDFALFGETTGESDEFGLPNRFNWCAEYRGKAAVVYGHTPVHTAEWFNNTINIDTGCVFGGRLTALRWPEREIYAAPANSTYYAPARVMLEDRRSGPPLSAQQLHDDLLEIEDVYTKRQFATSLGVLVTLREEQANAALEALTRFAVAPHWLRYLPPTMSPPNASVREGVLEHPNEAFAYFAAQQIPTVVCQEKHQGSRAVVIVCSDAEVARRRFGAEDQESGVIYSRSGSPLFSDRTHEEGLLQRIRAAITAAGLWQELATDWICLDAELLPWSLLGASTLARHASNTVAATTSLLEALPVVEEGVNRHPTLAPVLDRMHTRLDLARRHGDAWRSHWPAVKSFDEVRLAPFQLLATEGATYERREHTWHMELLNRLCESSSVLRPTRYRVVAIQDIQARAEAVDFWEDLTASGGAGIVVKPLVPVSRRGDKLVQPAIKVRGTEALRLVYGPDYTLDGQLMRLRARNLGPRRHLAMAEFALGLEALSRTIKREPLRRIHECVFATLALEAEATDPRL